MADRLIPLDHRHGRILDIGCGSYPYFLARTHFAEKVGIDKVVPIGDFPQGQDIDASIRLMSFDLEHDHQLPLDTMSVDVVTMLAVLEHIQYDRLVNVLNEAERVLRPGGLLIMTTPAGWTAPILTILKWLRLVSAIEIDEHQDAYSQRKIRALLATTRLADMPTRYQFFECWMNLCVCVTKPPESHSP